MTSSIVTAMALLLAGCGNIATPVQCPDPGLVAPASIGGTAFVRDLGGRLAGPDRENTITIAIAEMRRRDPTLGSDTITNVLIAADCPNVAARPDQSEAAGRARIAGFRAQVEQLLGE